MAYFAAVILVNARSLLKQNMYYDHVWDLLFLVFYSDALEVFCTIYSFPIFSNNECTNLR